MDTFYIWICYKLKILLLILIVLYYAEGRMAKHHFLAKRSNYKIL